MSLDVAAVVDQTSGRGSAVDSLESANLPCCLPLAVRQRLSVYCVSLFRVASCKYPVGCPCCGYSTSTCCWHCVFPSIKRAFMAIENHGTWLPVNSMYAMMSPPGNGVKLHVSCQPPDDLQKSVDWIQKTSIWTCTRGRWISDNYYDNVMMACSVCEVPSDYTRFALGIGGCVYNLVKDFHVGVVSDPTACIEDASLNIECKTGYKLMNSANVPPIFKSTWKCLYGVGWTNEVATLSQRCELYGCVVPRGYSATFWITGSHNPDNDQSWNAVYGGDLMHPGGFLRVASGYEGRYFPGFGKYAYLKCTDNHEWDNKALLGELRSEPGCPVSFPNAEVSVPNWSGPVSLLCPNGFCNVSVILSITCNTGFVYTHLQHERPLPTTIEWTCSEVNAYDKPAGSWTYSELKSRDARCVGAGCRAPGNIGNAMLKAYPPNAKSNQSTYAEPGKFIHQGGVLKIYCPDGTYVTDDGKRQHEFWLKCDEGGWTGPVLPANLHCVPGCLANLPNAEVELLSSYYPLSIVCPNEICNAGVALSIRCKAGFVYKLFWNDHHQNWFNTSQWTCTIVYYLGKFSAHWKNPKNPKIDLRHVECMDVSMEAGCRAPGNIGNAILKAYPPKSNQYTYAKPGNFIYRGDFLKIYCPDGTYVIDDGKRQHEFLLKCDKGGWTGPVLPANLHCVPVE